MAFKLILALALVSAASGFWLDYCDDKKIDGGILSLPCIIKGMCEAKNDQDKLTAFYACYDDIDTRQCFFDCMTFAFKGQLNNTKDVTRSCLTHNLLNVVPYGACLKYRFSKEEDKMDVQVDKINKCQAKALGYNAAE